MKNYIKCFYIDAYCNMYEEFQEVQQSWYNGYDGGGDEDWVEDEDKEYEAEQIVLKKVHRGKALYLVRWNVSIHHVKMCGDIMMMPLPPKTVFFG